MREGEELKFAIDRRGNDGQPHRIALSFDPAGLLVAPQRSVEFDPSQDEVSVTIETAKDSPGDGDRDLRIVLGTDQASTIGNPRFVDVTVLDRGSPWPWWPIAAAVAAAAGAAYAIRKFLFPPKLYPTWTTEPDFWPAEPTIRKLAGWPRFSREVTVEWGDLNVPQPLPIRKANDG